MADLFGEVDDDLRVEQARVLARRFGPAVLGLLLAALIAAGVWQYLAWRRQQADDRLSAAYFAAMRSADQPPLADAAAASRQAAALFAPIAREDAAGIGALARLRLAGLDGQTGDEKAAVETLDSLAGDTNAPRALRELATLASVQRQIGQKGSNLGALALRVHTIEGPTDPFRDVALETSATIQLAQGRADEARQTLQLLLADENATESIRERANTLLQAIGPSSAAR